jgi:predicted transcriptional regulator YdeE
MQLAVRDKKAFTIVGIDMRTTNQNGDAMSRIPAFWQKFYHDNIIKKIPSVVRPEIVYAVYSDYDEQGYYSMLLGVEADVSHPLPPGLVSITVPSSKYAVMTAKGPLPYAVPSAWEYIWSHDFPHTRAFRADFEIYDQRSKAVRDAEVDLYISIL